VYNKVYRGSAALVRTRHLRKNGFWKGFFWEGLGFFVDCEEFADFFNVEKICPFRAKA
jgi:hypothetical protein